jgi:molybdopterin converting factor small subunit
MDQHAEKGRIANAGEVNVTLAAPLADLFPGAPRRTKVIAGDVSHMVDALDEKWPGMRDRICDSTPAIRKHMNVFVEGRRARLETPLAPGADVYVLTAISGG